MRKLAILLHSGTYDKLYQATSMALTACAMGTEVALFLFTWSLKKFAEDRLDDPDFPAEHKDLTQQVIQNMAKFKTMPIAQMLAEARKTGRLKIYACTAFTQFLGIDEATLKAKCDDIVGMPALLTHLHDATTLFI